MSECVSANVSSVHALIPAELALIALLTALLAGLAGGLLIGRARELARRAAKLADRSRLTHTVLHDVRSPLISVHAIATSLLEADQVAPLGGVRAQLDSIKRCAELMEQLVSDLLDAERIGAGRLSLVHAPFRVSELVCGALATFAATAEARGVTINVMEEAGTHNWVIGDYRRLLQSLNNGLSNALKFSARGQRIALRGVGLSPEELAELGKNEAFTQVGLGKAQGNGGSGLELGIVRELLRMHHNSTLEISSNGHGRGTTFAINAYCKSATGVPPTDLQGSAAAGATAAAATAGAAAGAAADATVAADTAAAVTAAAAATEPAARSPDSTSPEPARDDRDVSTDQPTIDRELPRKLGYRVLHADDCNFMRMALPLQTFDKLGIEYEQAKDGLAATQLLESGRRFHCAVLDNQMPRISGAGLAYWIRARGEPMLVVGMTGDPVGCEDRLDFEAAGLDLCLEKNAEGTAALVDVICMHAARLLLQQQQQQPRQQQP
ncbi:hypothetical protein T492DRAFT_1142322, partial [Pavlovales sp. CCMP2436]